MAESEIQLVARSLIKAYGAKASGMARKSADNVRPVDLPDRLVWWEQVIAEIKRRQAAA